MQNMNKEEEVEQQEEVLDDQDPEDIEAVLDTGKVSRGKKMKKKKKKKKKGMNNTNGFMMDQTMEQFRQNMRQGGMKKQDQVQPAEFDIFFEGGEDDDMSQAHQSKRNKKKNKKKGTRSRRGSAESVKSSRRQLQNEELNGTMD